MEVVNKVMYRSMNNIDFDTKLGALKEDIRYTLEGDCQSYGYKSVAFRMIDKQVNFKVLMETLDKIWKLKEMEKRDDGKSETID